eukprot:CAMPEP_0194551272 /NCGR_PEP_ID=MMETSP0253-20130528/96137_1 /TAXON_ID=2966 /ORGANISM="Noctiluca scintillans" /LENGTH=1562 /DNA_ID=CAMNT_0039398729 /DNA_START=42 /DNA_END=4730 /DNA_ORIENTATION=-
MAESKPSRDGWLMKRSRYFQNWKGRFVSLWTEENVKEAVECANDICGTSSETFELARILDAFPVPDEHFGRKNCFVIEYSEKELPKDGFGTPLRRRGESAASSPSGSFVQAAPSADSTPRGTPLRSRKSNPQGGDQERTMTPKSTPRDMTPQTNAMRRKSLPESAVVVHRGSAMISARRKASVAVESLARKSSQCSTPGRPRRTLTGDLSGSFSPSCGGASTPVHDLVDPRNGSQSATLARWTDPGRGLQKSHSGTLDEPRRSTFGFSKFLRGGVSSGDIKIRTVGFQATNEKERDLWVSAVVEAIETLQKRLEEEAAKRDAEERAKELARLDALRVPEEPQEGETEVAAGKGPVKGPPLKGKGNGKGPPPPKGKGNGKGKGPPPPPGGESASGKGGPKGKGKGKESIKGMNLNPLGRKMGLAPIVSPRGEEANKGEVGDSIFDHLMDKRCDKLDQDIEQLEIHFKRKTETTRVMKKKQEKKNVVLSDKDAQNIAIVLRTLPHKDADLERAVEMLEPGAMDASQLERLGAALPSGPDLIKLKAYAGNEDDLRDVERSIIRLIRYPRIEQRFRAMGVLPKLEMVQSDLNKQMVCLQSACKELRTSEILRSVLAAVFVMFNYVNYGSVKKDGARAFDIPSLLKLNQFKTQSGLLSNFNGLHYVVLRLLADLPHLQPDSLDSEIKSVHKASGVNLNLIKLAIKQLSSEEDFLVDEFTNHVEDYGGKVRRPKNEEEPPALERDSSIPDDANTMRCRSDDIASVGTIDHTYDLHHVEELGPGKESAVGGFAEDYNAGFDPHDTRKRSQIFRKLRSWVRSKRGFEGNLQPAMAQTAAPSLPRQMVRSAPPPLWLRLAEPDSSRAVTWRRTLVKIAANGLLSFSKDEGGRMQYAVLCGAHVYSMRSDHASTEAHEAAETCKNGLEIQEVGIQGAISVKTRLWLDIESAQQAGEWKVILDLMTRVPGTGFLWVQERHGFWRWRWVVLHAETEKGSFAGAIRGEKGLPRGSTGPSANHSFVSDASDSGGRLLAWYRTPGEYLRSEAPIGGIILTGLSEAFSFEQQGHADVHRFPYGFEILTQTAESANTDFFKAHAFSTTSNSDMERWMSCVSGDGSSKTSRTHSFVSDFTSNSSDAGEGTPRSVRPMTIDDFAAGTRDGNDSSATSTVAGDTSDSESDADEEVKPYQHLKRMKLQLNSSVKQLNQYQSETVADCTRTLRYFKQQKSDDASQLSDQVCVFMSTFHKFSIMWATAFKEVVTLRQTCLRKGKPDPVASIRDGQEDGSLFGFSNHGTPRKSIARNVDGAKRSERNANKAGTLAWRNQLLAKKAAKSAVEALIANSNAVLVARWSAEVSVAQALSNLNLKVDLKLEPEGEAAREAEPVQETQPKQVTVQCAQELGDELELEPEVEVAPQPKPILEAPQEQVKVELQPELEDELELEAEDEVAPPPEPTQQALQQKVRVEPESSQERSDQEAKTGYRKKLTGSFSKGPLGMATGSFSKGSFSKAAHILQAASLDKLGKMEQLADDTLNQGEAVVCARLVTKAAVGVAVGGVQAFRKKVAHVRRTGA